MPVAAWQLEFVGTTPRSLWGALTVNALACLVLGVVTGAPLVGDSFAQAVWT